MTQLTTKLHENIHAAIVEALQLTGIASVVASYSGSGDSGDYFDIHAADAEGQSISPLPDVTVQYMDETSVWDREAKTHRKVKKEKTANLSSAIEDACWAAVSSSGHDGWENNGGGSGEYTVTADGSATLEHTDNYESEGDSDQDELDQNDEVFAEPMKRIAELLTANQAALVRIEYSGEGDSGSVSDISVEGEASLDAYSVTLSDYPVKKSTWVDGKWNHTVSLQSVSLASALEDLLWDAVTKFGHDGYENNEGGFGNLTINADGTGELSHTDNIETSETSSYTLLEPEEAEAAD